MDKKLLKFYLVALPLILLTFVYMQWDLNRKQKAWREANPEAAAAWDKRRTAEPEAEQTQTISPDQPALVPSAGEQAATAPAPDQPEAPRPTDVEPVTVTTEAYHVVLSPVGGVPVEWDIIDLPNGAHDLPLEPEEVAAREGSAADADAPKHGRIALIDPELDKKGHDRPFEIVLKEDNARYYNEFNQQVYNVEREETASEHIVRFLSPKTESGIQVVKTYRFPKEKSHYQSSLTVAIKNEGTSTVAFNDRGQGLGIALGPGLGFPPEQEGGFGRGYDYTGPVYMTEKGVQSVSLDKDGSTEALVAPKSGIDWAGIHSRYFMMTLVPGVEPQLEPATAQAAPKPQGFTAGMAKLETELMETAIVSERQLPFFPRLEAYGPSFQIAPGETKETVYTIFAGPKDRDVLKAAPWRMDEILFYDSWKPMRGLALMMMSLLTAFHNMIGSWGIAIIGLVLTVRLLTFPIAHRGLKAQAKMMAEQAKIKPYLEKINEKYKNDPQKKNQEVMKLYREHNINPFGMLKGCMWMIIQLPIFFALYKLLSQSFALRGASFLWINDLSAPDHLFYHGINIPFLGPYFNLLPVLTALTQVFLGKLSFNPNSITDPNQAAMQKQMMYMMPVFVFVMTYSFPSGLVLYWFISNVWQVFQQQFVNKKILHPPQPPAGGLAAETAKAR